MSVHAGTIVHVGGNNVIDRIQSAGLGDAQQQFDVIREVGNDQVIDKVPGDPDFTFTLESLDVSTELEAWLTGKLGTALADPAAGPGAADAAGTGYRWLDCKNVNIASPWKDPVSGQAGAVVAGHILPGYYPTRLRYEMGVTDNAQMTVELGGGSYYYALHAPIEQLEQGDGVETDFATTDPAVGQRIGGGGGTTFRHIFGVLVNGVLQVEGLDYTQTGPQVAPANGPATVSFITAPPVGADIRFLYFTTAARAFPQAVHADTIVKPGAVRGRNICVYLGDDAERVKLGGVQSFNLEATVDSTVDREFCNEDPTGRTVNGRDTTGQVVVRSKDAAAFMGLLSKITGVPAGEVVGWLNLNDVPLTIEIQNPKNPAQILKTLRVDDAIFTVPGTPSRVNSPTDFTLQYQSRSGDYTAYKGAMP